MKRLLLLAFLSVSLFQVSQVKANHVPTGQIDRDTVSVLKNKTMALTYHDGTQSFSIKNLSVNRTFVTQMRLANKIKEVRELGITDPVFGNGREMVVTTIDGQVLFQLFDKQ